MQDDEALDRLQKTCGHEWVFSRDATRFPIFKCSVCGKVEDASWVNDPVSPSHYQEHPSGIECIQITEHLNFCIGNAIKYLWRAGKKGDAVEDLRKAVWYIEREIRRVENQDK